MRVSSVVVLSLLVACGAAGLEGPASSQPRLDVTERSGTTLLLHWDAMGTADRYTVDYLTGLARCEDFPQHSNILEVSGTTRLVTGLTPSTRYNIHVHPLPTATQKTNTIVVTTLAAGSAAQAVKSSDYETCT